MEPGRAACLPQRLLRRSALRRDARCALILPEPAKRIRSCYGFEFAAHLLAISVANRIGQPQADSEAAHFDFAVLATIRKRRLSEPYHHLPITREFHLSRLGDRGHTTVLTRPAVQRGLHLEPQYR